MLVTSRNPEALDAEDGSTALDLVFNATVKLYPQLTGNHTLYRNPYFAHQNSWSIAKPTRLSFKSAVLQA